jgi:hypothetical protein
VDDIPPAELETILGVRSRALRAPAAHPSSPSDAARATGLPKQFCSAMVGVLRDLQLARSSSSLFAGKAGLVTPRDLLRWADRAPASYAELARHGFALLGERLRSEAEKDQVRKVLEKCVWDSGGAATAMWADSAQALPLPAGV